MILPMDPASAHLIRVALPIAPLIFGWVIAVPILLSIIGGVMAARGQKQAQEKAQKASQAKTNLAMSQLSPEHLASLSQTYFPGLLSKQPAQSQVSTTGAPAFSQGPITSSSALDDTSSSFKGIPARAAGGPVTAGQPYVVGEQGPEVITPTTGGTVTPNQGETPPTAPPATPDQTAIAPSVPTVPGNMKSAGPVLQQKGLGDTPAVGGPPPTMNASTPPAGVLGSTSFATPVGQTAGEMAVSSMVNYFQHPGQISSVGYEREQEQANQGLNFAHRAIGGTLSSSGVDPNSGYGQMLGQSAVLNAMKLRNEANRDFTLVSESMKRQDINTATQTYLQFLGSVFGLGSNQANTVVGSSENVHVPTTDPNAGLWNGVTTAGQTLGDYFAKKDQQTPTWAPSGSTGTDTLNTNRTYQPY